MSSLWKNSRLISDQVLLPCQNIIEDANDSNKLLVISLLCAFDLLGVEVAEPSGLTKVGPLAGHLEMKVLFGVVLLGK